MRIWRISTHCQNPRSWRKRLRKTCVQLWSSSMRSRKVSNSQATKGMAREAGPNSRDKASLDVFWLKDENLEDLDSLPEPEVLAEEIAEDLRAALEQFNALTESLEQPGDKRDGT